MKVLMHHSQRAARSFVRGLETAKCELFRLFLLNCDYSNKLFLLDCSQFKRNRRNISHFAEKKRPWNQALKGQNSDEDCEILKFIEDTERDIAAKSTEHVKPKGILTRDKKANLYKRREKILDYCKSEIIECPKEKLVRRLNRTGGRSANEKLACDIIALVNFYSSREIIRQSVTICLENPCGCVIIHRIF